MKTILDKRQVGIKLTPDYTPDYLPKNPKKGSRFYRRNFSWGGGSVFYIFEMKITWLSDSKIKKLLYIIGAFWKYKWLRGGRGILYLWHLLGWKPYLIICKKCRKNTWYLRRGRVLGVVHFWHLFSKSACYYRRILREQIDFRWQKISGGGDQNHSSLSAKKLSKKWLILEARFGLF